jgi:hypothetical protein
VLIQAQTITTAARAELFAPQEKGVLAGNASHVRNVNVKLFFIDIS